MLPPRSKRIAGIDTPLPRLRLINPWQLGVATLLLAALFALIFPRRALLEALHEQERFDDLAIDYLDNLRRVETGDDDLTILVTRAGMERMRHAEIEAALLPIVNGGDERLRGLAMRTLAAADVKEMQRLVVDYHGQAPMLARLGELYERVRASGSATHARAGLALWREALLRTPGARLRADAALRAHVLEALRTAESSPPVLEERIELAALALHAGMEAQAQRLFAGIDAATLRARLPGTAASALGRGQHETAGRLYLLARDMAATRAQARELFRQGIGAYMAGELYANAMEAAERHLGDLADDRETLRFLVRSAMAAGDAQRAAWYARRLVFRTQEERS